MRPTRRTLVLPVLALAACQAEESGEVARDAVAQQAETPAPASFAPADAAAPSLVLEVEGLHLVLARNAKDLLAFGMQRPRLEAIVGRVLDRLPERRRIDECGAGPMEFTTYGPLQLNFQGGAFVGWFLDEPGGLSTMDGVGIGSPRGQVQSGRILTMIPDSTLGEEFTLGELTEESIGGFFDGPGTDAKVSQLFAGINCFFR